MKIIAPVKCNGVYASVMFKDGIGECDNKSLIKWFERNGYEVVKEPLIVEMSEDATERINQALENLYCDIDFQAMTSNELREWMKENGFAKDIKNIKNKDKLIEIIKSRGVVR